METVVNMDTKKRASAYGLDANRIIDILNGDASMEGRQSRFKEIYKDFMTRVLISMGDTMLREMLYEMEFSDEHKQEIETRVDFCASQSAAILEKFIRDYYQVTVRLIGEHYGEGR